MARLDRLGGALLILTAISGCSRDEGVPAPPEDATSDTFLDTIGSEADAPDVDADAGEAPDATDSIAPDADAGCGPFVDLEGFDLDGDGTRESRLSLAACAGAPDTTCLVVTSPLSSAKEIKLANVKNVCTGTVAGPGLLDIGQHAGGAAHEVSVSHCGVAPTLSIVDVQAGAVIASVRAPIEQRAAYVDAVRDPSGKLHPFLAPSYGDANPVDPTYGAGKTWGYLCLYDPSRAPDVARCAAGFASASTTPEPAPAYFFREVGGYVQDLDGDGWEDVNVLFHTQVLALSGRTGSPLSRLVYDVSAASEPSSPKWFHSGRNYGTHAAFASADGKLRTLEVGATPVGSFTDYNCNVSRFIAVLDSTPGAPGTRRLAWSRYVSFASSLFSTYVPAYAADPSSVVTRLGNFVDGCVHRFSDSRTVIDGKEAVLYDVFHGKTVDTCLVAQYALYLDPTWTADKQKAWGDCQTKNLGAKGTWAMEALAVADGTSITGSLGTYVWGWSSALTPGGETLYLVEAMPGDVAFDLRDRPASKLQVYSLVKGMWTSRGTFPVPGRPKVRSEAPSGPRGVGSYTGFAELTLADRDCDGLLDVQLEDGTWVGFSKAAGAFATK